MDIEDGPLTDLTPEEQEILAEMARAGSDGRVDRRALIQLAGLVGVGGLAALASGRARADASNTDGDGDIGSPSNPVDLFAAGVTINDNLNGGGPIADGDGTERKIWVINNGAADPAGAGNDDIILEKEA